MMNGRHTWALNSSYVVAPRALNVTDVRHEIRRVSAPQSSHCRDALALVYSAGRENREMMRALVVPTGSPCSLAHDEARLRGLL